MSGRVIAGRYRLDEPIGRGAMGVVWRARDELLDRDIAVKEVLISEALSDDERENAYQRTLREARTAARLSHRGVVAVYDVAEEDGRPWIVMELVHAQSLDQILTDSGPLSPRLAGQMGQQLLAALATAHAAGVLHRDVKPSNVLLGDDGRAVLTDFGIATFQGDPRLTQTGMVMGSPGYTAPERIRGGPATPASDLWSLGATLFTAVEGHGPFEQRGGAITTMSAIIHEDPPPASSAGPLGGIIAALLRREPSARPDALTASRLIASLLPVLPEERGRTDTVASAVAAQAPSYADAAQSSGAPPATAPSGAGAGPGPSGRASTGTADLPAVAAESDADPAGSETAVADPVGPPVATAPSKPSWPPSAGSAAAPSGPPGSSAQGASFTPTPPPSEWAAPRTPWESPAAAEPTWGVRPPVPSARRASKRGLRITLSAAAIALAAVAGAGAALAIRHHQTPRSTGGASTTQDLTPAPTQTQNGPLTALDQPLKQLPSDYSALRVEPSAIGTKAGFLVGVPDSWKPVRFGTLRWRLYSPDGGSFLHIDLTPHTFPDMLTEATFIRNTEIKKSELLDYKEYSLSRATVRGTRGAIWAFSWVSNGQQLRAEDILFRVPTAQGYQSYALFMVAPMGQWTSELPSFEQILRTFEPVQTG